MRTSNTTPPTQHSTTSRSPHNREVQILDRQRRTRGAARRASGPHTSRRFRRARRGGLDRADSSDRAADDGDPVGDDLGRRRRRADDAGRTRRPTLTKGLERLGSGRASSRRGVRDAAVPRIPLRRRWRVGPGRDATDALGGDGGDRGDDARRVWGERVLRAPSLHRQLR